MSGGLVGRCERPALPGLRPRQLRRTMNMEARPTCGRLGCLPFRGVQVSWGSRLQRERRRTPPCPREEESPAGAGGIDRLAVRVSGQLLDCLVCVWPEERTRARRGRWVARSAIGEMVEGRNDQPVAARFPGYRIRTVGRTVCQRSCCCPTSDYPRSNQRGQESHHTPHATPPFRSANQLIRSAAVPDPRIAASWCQEALETRRPTRRALREPSDRNHLMSRRRTPRSLASSARGVEAA